MGADPRGGLRRRVLAAVSGAESSVPGLLSEIWAYQTAHCPTLAAHARAHGLPVGHSCPIDAIRPLPTSAWRAGDLACWDVERAPGALTFRSSGTSGGGSSLHRLRETGLYDAALIAGFEAVLPEAATCGRFGWISLLPDRRSWPWSSLAFMLDAWMERWAEGGGEHAAKLDGAPDLECVRRAIESSRRSGRPVVLAGAAFSHVLLLDAAGPGGLPLPEGSVVIETGGTKGRSRAVGHGDLREMLRRGYGVAPEAIWTEYGMAELGSQAWGRGVLGAGGAWERPVLRFPPWVRWSAVDPDTGAAVDPGEVGLLRIYDPVNLDSCAFVGSFDLVRRAGDEAFCVLGRAPQAEIRGCSLAVPELPSRSSTEHVGVRRPAPPRAERSMTSAGRRAQGLAAAWTELRDPDGAAGDAAAIVARAAGLSTAQVSEALDREAARWDAVAMEAIIRRELLSWGLSSNDLRPVARSLVIPASTVPFAGLESLTVGLLAGAGVTVRPSSRNPVEVGLFRRALERAAPHLAESLVLVDHGDVPGLAAAMAEAETVVVHGDSATVSEIRGRVAPDAVVVAYGPRWSLAILDPEDAGDAQLLRRLADDVLLHDGLGCMSPRAILTPGSQEQAVHLSLAFGQALSERAEALPPHPEVALRPSGVASPDEAVLAFARCARPVLSASRWGTGWTLLLDPPSPVCPGLPIEPPPIRRGTAVAAVAEDAPPGSWWPAATDPLSTVAVSARARASARAAEIETAVLSRGAGRITEPGRMQTPPPAWPHDGLPLLSPFWRRA
jgi:hypothetical protein